MGIDYLKREKIRKKNLELFCITFVLPFFLILFPTTSLIKSTCENKKKSRRSKSNVGGIRDLGRSNPQGLREN